MVVKRQLFDDTAFPGSAVSLTPCTLDRGVIDTLVLGTGNLANFVMNFHNLL
jgi:hypothetical protein